MAVITTEAIPIFQDSEKNNRRMRTLGDMMKDFLTGGGTVVTWGEIKPEILNFLNLLDDGAVDNAHNWTQKEIQKLETNIIGKTCEPIVKGNSICPHLIFYDASRIPKELLLGKSQADFDAVKVIQNKLLEKYRQDYLKDSNLQPPPPIPVVVMTGPSLADPANNRMVIGKSNKTSPFVNTFPKEGVKVIIESDLLKLYLGIEIGFSYEYIWERPCVEGNLDDVGLRESLNCKYTYEKSNSWTGVNPVSKAKDWNWDGNGHIFKTERTNTVKEVTISGHIAPKEADKAPWFKSNNSKGDIITETKIDETNSDGGNYRFQDAMESHKGKNDGDALQPLAQLICDMLLKKYGFFYQDDNGIEEQNLCTFNFGEIRLGLDNELSIKLTINREPVAKDGTGTGKYYSNMMTAPYRTVMLSPDKNLPYLCNTLSLKCCYTGGSSPARITRADGFKAKASSNQDFQRQISLTRQIDSIKKIQDSLRKKSLRYQSKLLYKAQAGEHPKCFLGRQGEVGRRNRLGYKNINGTSDLKDYASWEERIIKQPILNLLNVIIIAYEYMNFNGEGSEILDSEIFTTKKTCSMVACMRALIFSMMSGGVPPSGIVHNILGIDLSMIEKGSESNGSIIKTSLLLLKEILNELSNPEITHEILEGLHLGFIQRISDVQADVENTVNGLKLSVNHFIGLDDYEDYSHRDGHYPDDDPDVNSLTGGAGLAVTATDAMEVEGEAEVTLTQQDESLKLIIKGLLTIINHNDRNHMKPLSLPDSEISSKFGDNRPLFPDESTADGDLKTEWAKDDWGGDKTELFNGDLKTEWEKDDWGGDKTELFNGGDDDGNVNNLFEIIKSEFKEHRISRTLRSLILYNIINIDTLLFAYNNEEYDWFLTNLHEITKKKNKENITTMLIYCAGNPVYRDVVREIYSHIGNPNHNDVAFDIFENYIANHEHYEKKFEPSIEFVRTLSEMTRKNLHNIQPKRSNKRPHSLSPPLSPPLAKKPRTLKRVDTLPVPRDVDGVPSKGSVPREGPAPRELTNTYGGGVNKKRYNSGKQTHSKNKSHKKKQIYNKIKKKKSHKEIRKPQRKKSHKEIRKPQRKKSHKEIRKSQRKKSQNREV